MDSRKLARVSDDDLLKELQSRFDQKNKALKDLQTMNEKLDVAHTRLLEADALKSQFLAIIRNEFRNPLGAIVGLARMVADKKIVDEHKLSEIMETMLMETHNLSFQLDNILEAAMLEAGEQQLVQQHIDLSGIVEDVLQEHKYDIMAKSLTVTTDMAAGHNVMGDGEKFKIVVANLVSNAVKVSPVKGEILVVLQPRDHELVLSVADEGEGIKQEDARIIFERFKQADMGIARKHSGAGLGLSVAAALAELHGGKIWHEARPGGGTVFYASLALANQQEASSFSGSMNDTAENSDVLFF